MLTMVNPENRSETLTREADRWLNATDVKYPVINQIPRFVESVQDEGQIQTSQSFGYKWNRQSDWGFKSEHQPVVWSIWKDFFGWESPDDLRQLMQGKKVLDAGCGSGASMYQFAEWPEELWGVDISTAVDACRENFKHLPNCHFVQADLCNLPFAEESFDVVWSNGVLHHTPNTFESLKSITRHAKKGGLVIFYIYVQKAPIREFVDDYLRALISPLPHEQAWERMQAFTRFSKNLSDTNTSITIEEDFPELGFKAGTYDLQRFVYYSLFKCFWNPGLSFEDNVNVNFDWYHPTYSHRHSPDEVKVWLDALALKPQSFRVSESGIAVIAERM